MATKWGAIAGIIFALTLVAGLMVTGSPPSGDDTDDQVISWYSDSGNQKMQLASAYLLTVSGMALVGFVTLALGPQLARRSRNEGDTALASLVPMLGVLAAACIVIGAFPVVAVSAEALFSNDPIDPGVARFLPSAGYGIMLVGGGLSAALMVVAAAMHALRTGSLAKWLAWLGVLCAVVLLAAVIFLPMAALPLWVILVSVVLLIQKDETPAA